LSVDEAAHFSEKATVPVVLKGVPLGSPSRNFSFLRRNLFQGGIGEENPWMKSKYFIICLFNAWKLHNEVGLNGNVYIKQGQAALTAVPDVIKEYVRFAEGIGGV